MFNLIRDYWNRKSTVHVLKFSEKSISNLAEYNRIVGSTLIQIFFRSVRECCSSALSRLSKSHFSMLCTVCLHGLVKKNKCSGIAGLVKNIFFSCLQLIVKLAKSLRVLFHGRASHCKYYILLKNLIAVINSLQNVVQALWLKTIYLLVKATFFCRDCRVPFTCTLSVNLSLFKQTLPFGEKQHFFPHSQCFIMIYLILENCVCCYIQLDAADSLSAQIFEQQAEQPLEYSTCHGLIRTPAAVRDTCFLLCLVPAHAASPLRAGQQFAELKN